MPILLERVTLTPTQYLAQERLAESKSEYIDGELCPMPGVSLEHDRIVRSVLCIYGKIDVPKTWTGRRK